MDNRPNCVNCDNPAIMVIAGAYYCGECIHKNYLKKQQLIREDMK